MTGRTCIGPSPIASRVFEELERDPDRVAVIDERRSYRAGELLHLVHGVARNLTEIGGSTPRVLATLPNCGESVALFLATMAVGGVWGSVNPRYAVAERQALTRRFDPTVIVDEEASLAEIADSASSAVCMAIRPGDGLRELICETDESDFNLPEVDELDIAAVGFTSGTSGRPSGVLHCQRSLLLAAEANLSGLKPSGPIGVVLSTMVLNIMLLGPLQGLLAGRTVALAQRTEGEYLAHWCMEYKIAEIGVPPTIVHDLLAQYELIGNPGVIPERVETGGASCTSALQQRFNACTGRTLIRCYGLTEAPGTVAVSPSAVSPVTDSSGMPMPHVVITIRDDEGAALCAGAVGEICVSAAEQGRFAGQYLPMLGYLDDPGSNPVEGGVLHTGDLGRLDDDGRLFVTGRKSDMIIRGGANISPAEVEDALLRHSAVADSAVFGVPDERLGEVVAAAVVLNIEYPQVTCVELQAYVEDRLGRHKSPKHVIFLGEIPRNPTGKPDRTVLMNALRAAVCSVG